jgi:gamma-glutamylcyclotransferase (GGCT)/AIG2-like uncharacterized protein YtfP
MNTPVTRIRHPSLAHPRRAGAACGRPLFVYGTLLPGGGAHARLTGLADLGAASVAGRLYTLGRYPALRPARWAGERVHGRLYGGLDARRLAALDRYEDAHPEARGHGEYQRVACLARRTDGRVLRTWVYAYRHPLPEVRRLADGRWPGPGARR